MGIKSVSRVEALTFVRVFRRFASKPNIGYFCARIVRLFSRNKSQICDHSEKRFAGPARILNIISKMYRCFFFVSVNKLSVIRRIYSSSFRVICRKIWISYKFLKSVTAFNLK